MVIPGIVETDFYNDIKVSPKLAKDIKNLPYALKAFSTPIEEAVRVCVCQVVVQLLVKSFLTFHHMISLQSRPSW